MKKKIFLLEDNEDINDMITYLLSKQGFEVSSFITIKEFKIKLANELPDLFILDIMLPDGNGVDVCNELKSDSTTRQVPVLLMSANLKFKDDATADGFISKPFDINDFMKKTEELIA